MQNKVHDKYAAIEKSFLYGEIKTRQFPIELTLKRDDKKVWSYLLTKMCYPNLRQIMLFCLVLAHSVVWGQQSWRLEFEQEEVKKEVPVVYPNLGSLHQGLSNYYSHLLTEGYLDAVLDTTRTDSVMKVTVHKGNKYTIGSINWTMDSLVISPAKSIDFHKPKNFDVNLIQEKSKNILKDFENNGYPFASLQLAQLKMKNHNAEITLHLNEGPRIVMDSVIIRSQTKLPVRYIRSYLDFRRGDVYEEDKVLKVAKRLRELPFLTVRQSPEIRFKPGKADLFLFVEKKKANYFNGILGIRPDDKTGKVNITGDMEIKLLNAFNTGEELYLNWRKMQAQTQDLAVKILLPYLFSSPIGIDGQLKIYKRDSTFTSVKTGLGLVFNFGGNNRLRAFAEKNATNQLATYATAQPLANVNSTLYGLSLNLEKLDYRFNPRSGYSINIEGATGNRNVASSNQTAETNAANAVNKNVHRFEAAADYYIPTWKIQCIRISGRGAQLSAPSIFENEMYRLGGIRTLRGVDEESIYTTSYAVGTIEYRLLFEENSAVYIFADQAWYEKKGINNFITDTPIGFGAGVNFETKAGIFTFNYALGHQFDNPILIRNAKISFGFRNVF